MQYVQNLDVFILINANGLCRVRVPEGMHYTTSYGLFISF